MGINHLKPAYTDKAKPFIEEFGGKLGGLEFLRTIPGIRDRILQTIMVKPDENWKGKLPEGGRFIVRASHPNDFQGLVDVIDTKRDIRMFDVRDAIDSIRLSAASPDVISYGKYENPSYDGNVVIGIQPYKDMQIGTVVEHPNRPGKFMVSIFDFEKERRLFLASVMFDESTGKTANLLDYYLGYKIENIREIVSVYREIQSSGLVTDDHVFQVEFLYDSVDLQHVTQVRAFKEREVVKPFEIPEATKEMVIGVTPEEGVELDLFVSPAGLDNDGQPMASDVPWAFLKTNHSSSTPLSFQPHNLSAYLVSQSFYTGATTSLDHMHFRLAQKADLTIFEGDARERSWRSFGELLRKAGLSYNKLISGKVPIKVRVTSNGIVAKVEPVL